jgi:hypothetical protein
MIYRYVLLLLCQFRLEPVAMSAPKIARGSRAFDDGITINNPHSPTPRTLSPGWYFRKGMPQSMNMVHVDVIESLVSHSDAHSSGLKPGEIDMNLTT